ncbi:MAG: 6-carboxytetrahydropterin synthase [bacterium]
MATAAAFASGSGATNAPRNGFVVDFGGLKVVKSWLTEHFDHTLLLDADDPLLQSFRARTARRLPHRDLRRRRHGRHGEVHL